MIILIIRYCGPRNPSSVPYENGLNGLNNGAKIHKRISDHHSEYSMLTPMTTMPPEAVWHAANTNECVQPKLTELKREIYLFTTTDNFDESLIVNYLDKLLDATLNSIKSSTSAASASSSLSTYASSNPRSTLTSSSSGGGSSSSSDTGKETTTSTTNSFRSIHDVSTIIDAMFYLINAQVCLKFKEHLRKKK